QHDDQREHHGVVEIPKGRGTEERAQGQPAGELPGRALGVQGLDERLDELQDEHTAAPPQGAGRPGAGRASRPVVETRTSNVAGRVAATKVAEPYSASTSGPSKRPRALEERSSGLERARAQAVR